MTTIPKNALDLGNPTGPFAPPLPRRTMLDIPGIAWQEAADRLTEWTVDRMVVHPEVYMSYDRPFTIRRHYCHEWDVHDIWLRPVSTEGMSKWFVISINHQCEDPAHRVVVNWQAAAGWYEELQSRGLKPLLLDSNGGEDIELLVLLAEEIPATQVMEFVRGFVSDYATRGLVQVPAFMPNNADIAADRDRKGWRVFGQYAGCWHSTRAWNGERWLEGKPAIEAILATTGDSPELITRSI